jgi:entericidin B
MALLASIATCILATAMLSGCNTTEGVGEDIEAAGDALSDTARDAKD